jgi:hypothetical protein
MWDGECDVWCEMWDGECVWVSECVRGSEIIIRTTQEI